MREGERVAHYSIAVHHHASKVVVWQLLLIERRKPPFHAIPLLSPTPTGLSLNKRRHALFHEERCCGGTEATLSWHSFRREPGKTRGGSSSLCEPDPHGQWRDPGLR